MTATRTAPNRSTLLWVSHAAVYLGILLWAVANTSFLHESVHSLAHTDREYGLLEKMLADGTPLIAILPVLILLTVGVLYQCEIQIAKSDLVTAFVKGYANALVFNTALFAALFFMMRNTGQQILQETGRTIAIALWTGFILALIYRLTDRPLYLVIMGAIPVPLSFAISFLSTQTIGGNTEPLPALYPSVPKLVGVVALVCIVSSLLYTLWARLEPKGAALRIAGILFSLGAWFILSCAAQCAAMIRRCTCESFRYQKVQMGSLFVIFPLFVLSWALILALYRNNYKRTKSSQ